MGKIHTSGLRALDKCICGLGISIFNNMKSICRQSVVTSQSCTNYCLVLFSGFCLVQQDSFRSECNPSFTVG